MAELFWCTHKNPNSGSKSTILHGGHECSAGNQDNACAYFQMGWDFVRCEAAIGALVRTDEGIREVRFEELPRE